MSKARSRARRLAMQGLYEWQMSDNAPSTILKTCLTEQNVKNVDTDYLQELLLTIPKKQPELDSAFQMYLDRSVEEVDPIELAILRLATYELLFRIDVPYRVVINEAIELAKAFGAEAGHKFVNGILDKVAAQVRKTEFVVNRNADKSS
jgi:N utilization substance protein B